MTKEVRFLIGIILSLTLSLNIHAQNRISKVNGYVSDEQKAPVVGACVKIEGTEYVTVTDQSGRYAISGTWGETARLRVSFMGFADKIVAIGGKQTINVVLSEDTRQMGEVTVKARTNVNAIDVRGLVGQVQSMDMKRVEEKPMIDFALSLQGQVPGLMVVNSGELGSAPQIRIRGNSSLRTGNVTNEPLYVMDGQVISSEVFYNLNPQDIKDIKVLKDAAACALYGVKAANGVIEVTSQRGYQGKTIVSYSTNIGITTRGRRGIKMMDSAEKLELERLLRNPETPGYRYSADYYNRYYANDPNLEQYIAEGEAELQRLRGINTDWFNTLLRNNLYHRHNVSVKGGNEQTTYYISGNYSYQGGRIRGNDKQKMGIRLNLDQKLGQIGYFMVSVNGSYTETNTPNGSNNDPTALIYQLNPYEQTTGELWSYPGQTYDDLMHQYQAKSNDKNAGATASLTLMPVKGLDISAVAGIDFLLDEGNSFTPSTAYSETHGGISEIERGIYSQYKNTTSNLTTNIRATYNHTFAGKHDLTVGANMDYYLTNIDNEAITGYGVGEINSAAAINQSLEGSRKPYINTSRDKNAQVGYGLVAGYTYNGLYDAYATYKLDGSSILPEDKRWNTAWAVGAGWTPSNYGFLRDNKVLTRLNFKVSYGVTANLNGVSISSTVASFRYSTLSYEDQRPLDFVSLYNSDLVPEQNKDFNCGMGVELWNRLGLELNWYNRKTEQALLDVPVPSSTGYTSLMRNIGALQNRGIEFSLNAKVIDTYDWRLTLGFNVAYNDNKVLDLYYTDKIYGSEEALVPDYEVGKSYDMLYGPKSLGINPLTGYPVFSTPGGEKQATETLLQEDVVALGHLTPPYSGSFKISFAYKTFELDADFYYVHGGYQRFNYSYVRNKDTANKNAVHGQTENMWFKQGDENKTYWTPFYTSSTAETNIALYPNSRTVGKSDYVRLSMLSLRYRVPSKWLKKCLPFIEYATLALQGSNLFTWTGYNESDPESGQLAGTTQPVYTFNMNLTF